METWEMEAEAEPADEQSAQSNQPPNPKKRKRKQPQHSADIDISSLLSLSEALKDDTDIIIGLQYIWEFRSPSQTVLSHYQCKLCSFNNTQQDIISHIKGWKHTFKYLTKDHPDKISLEEKDIDNIRTSEVKKAVKVAAAEVEKAEGRGQIKVILMEPHLVPAFKKFNSAYPLVARMGTPLDISSLRSLSEALKDVTDTIIGLHNIWEYRSPSKTVLSHYQCKLCSYSSTQQDMIDHIKGWKHTFRYLSNDHPGKITLEEKGDVGANEIKRAVKFAAAEVEKAEGRGQIKVILMEPYLVSAFKKFNSAFPVAARPQVQGKGAMRPPLGPRSHDSRFPGEFLTHGRPLPYFPSGEYKESGYGSYMSTPAFPDRGNGPGPLSDSIGPGRNGYGRGGAMVEGSNTLYPKEYQENFKDRPVSTPNDRPGLLGAAPQSNNTPALLKYLETFQIENENDAQLVLKVTKKLTDALMEYRLRNIPAASTFISPSMMPTNLSNVPQRLQGDRYSSNPSGPSRYPDGPQRYFN